MKIAIIGIRGIPFVYSGFETFAENLSVELVKRGFRVTVYCRSPYIDQNLKNYKGVKIKVLWVPKSKNWETFLHSFFSTLNAIFEKDFDVIYYLGVGSAPFSILPRIFGIKTVVNVDGLDWKREKWGIIAKTYLYLSQYLAAIFPNKIITDSLYIKKYYREKFAREGKYIPYPYISLTKGRDEVLKRHFLKKKEYICCGGRFVPDNHLDELLKAIKLLPKNIICVFIGSDTIETEYKRKLVKAGLEDKRLIFTGFVEHQEYLTLVKNSIAYIETKRSGGTHPSLVEAMGVGAAIISNNHLANREVLDKGAIFYKAGSPRDLALKIKYLVKSPKLRIALSKIARNRAQKKYALRKVIETYDIFLREIIRY